jgi:ABC-type lipopolysaccharide export system ATPase subunit
MLSLYGFLSVAVQLAFFPPLHRQFGSIKCLRGTLPGYFLVAAAGPIITQLAQNGASKKTTYALVAGLVLVKACANTSFASMSIQVNAS